METVDWRGQSERIRALEARTTTWLRVAVVQQVLLVGLLASAYLSWGDAGHLEGLHAKVQTLEQGTRLDAHDARRVSEGHASGVLVRVLSKLF